MTQPHNRRFQAYHMCTDKKPKGEIKRQIRQQNRTDDKREITDQLREVPYDEREDDICPGCGDCECRLCGGPIVVSASESAPHCLTCGDLPNQAVIGEDP